MIITDNTNQTPQAPAITTTADRACRICRTGLTDAASLNEGIGPICRRKANQALARTLRTDINKMDVIGYFGISFALPTEAQATWQLVQDVINKINQDQAGLDLRQTVKQIAWILSFDLPRTTVETLFSLVEALGYTAFANLLRLEGENGSGAAALSFANGVVTLKAPRSRPGRDALKAIKGVFFKAAPDNTWNAPASAAAAFIKAAARHWPLVTGNDTALQEAQAWLTTASPAAVTTAAQAIAQTEVKISMQGGRLLVKSPFNADFVTELKTLPFRDRNWTGAEWSVSPTHQQRLAAMIAKHYTNAKIIGL